MGVSIGKLRGLQKIAGDNGIFTMCAMDHRGSLEKKLCAGLTAAACGDDMMEFKLELCRSLSPFASAVLLDPIYGASQAIEQGLLPRSTGLLVSLEETGYQGSGESRETRLLAGWSVAKIKQMGADAAKLLVYYRPDIDEVARRQRDLVLEVAAECELHDLPCLVEAVSYPVGKEVSDPALFARHKPELIIQTARDLTSLPIDVLKAEFPADLATTNTVPEALGLCRELEKASAKPWVILSGGADYDTFSRQMSLACQAGASGYLAGRAVWQEAITMEDAARRSFLAGTAVVRLKQLAATAGRYAVPWQRKLGFDRARPADAGPSWYLSYGAGP